MKHVICGDGKGYLIPKKELDSQLRQKFKALKGKHISSIGMFTSRGVGVCYYDEALMKKEKDLIILPEDKEHTTLVFNKKLLKEIFDFKQDIKRIELKEEVEKGRFHSIFSGETLIDDENMYYFLNTREDPYYEVISEVPET